MNPTPQPTPQNPNLGEGPQPAAPPNPPAQPSPVASPVPMPAAPVQSEPSLVDTPATPDPIPVASSPVEPMPAGGTVVMGGAGAGAETPPQPAPKVKKPWTRKRLLLLVALPVFLVVLMSGLVFGLYLPNTPNAVWNTGLDRTGTALDKLATKATSAEQLEKLKTTELTGTIDAAWDDSKFSGEITASYDEKDSDSGFKVEVTQDGAKQELAAKLLTQIRDGKNYPDIYFQVSGFGNFGLDTYYPGINNYDGKWIVLDAEYIETMAKSLNDDEETKPEEPTAADISEVTKAVTAVTNEYVFTTDSEKAVLIQKSFVGKEVIDGVKVNHYKANIDDDKAQAYCTALVNAVLDTNAAKKISGADEKQIEKYKKDATKDCDQKYALKKDMDVWIGGKYRLIQKIRIHPNEGGKEYIDIGQKYDNGDEVTLYVAYTGEDKNTARFSVTTNVKTYATGFDVTAKSDDIDLSIKLNSQASNKDIKVTAPTNAVKFEDFMNAMMGGAQSAYSSELSQLQAEAAAEEERINNAGILQ